jgi:hypothetical protein
LSIAGGVDVDVGWMEFVPHPTHTERDSVRGECISTYCDDVHQREAGGDVYTIDDNIVEGDSMTE